MVEIVKTYKQSIPALRFIGIKYGDQDRVNGSYAAKWGEWFESDRFNKLQSLLTNNFKDDYEDANTNIGLMRWKEGEPFEYWIGMFLPEDAVAPEGFGYIDFQASNLGVCWVKGSIPEVYRNELECANKLSEEGHEIIKDEQEAWWFFERYGCPRFTRPDENGNVILDICHFVN
ncbi:hypothetical protein [Ureibacillus manganicus]|uniref:Uncharacterized protein n=1 Tax=Ureibacillus manganicus DSM 26584 TaxID=1384049 RepID=A0A0A3HXT7_9BACL|nr:hypothetical protein [Ureibacillus manganicus]KGR77406.1 hypothetical protein CD29_15170 [Ureibacillus manganicus DSM 26584]